MVAAEVAKVVTVVVTAAMVAGAGTEKEVQPKLTNTDCPWDDILSITTKQLQSPLILFNSPLYVPNVFYQID